AARHGQAHEVEVGQLLAAGALRVGLAEHDAADLDGADATLLVQRDRQRLRGIELGGEMGREGAAVDVDRVPPDGLDDRHSGRDQALAEGRHLTDAEGEVVLVEHFPQAESGTPWRRQTSRVPRTFSSETGWPPPELLVRVSMTRGTRPGLAARQASSLPKSMFPLKGWRPLACLPSATRRSIAVPPLTSTLARVVSKCVLLGTTSPGFKTVEKRRFSATRPWCVGMT